MKNIILNFLLHIWNLSQMLNVLEKKMNLIAYIYPKLLTPKDVVTWISKRLRFKTPLESQRVKGSKTLLKFAWKLFYPKVSSLWEKLSWKTSLTHIQNLNNVDTMIANDKYSLNYRETLPQ